MIDVIACGAGNLDSVRKALAFIGADARLTSDPGHVTDCAGAILPGVGAFSRHHRTRQAGSVRRHPPASARRLPPARHLPGQATPV